MSELYDVTLDGVGYMVRAGTYRRRQTAIDEARTGRVRLFDFYGGARRANQLERDRFWSGVGAWPTFDAQGVAAGPKRTDHTETAGSDPTKPAWSFAWGGYTYVVNNDKLFRVTTGGGGVYSGLTLLTALTAGVVGAALVDDYLCFAHGGAVRCTSYNLLTSVYKSDYVNAPKWAHIAGGAAAFGVDPANRSAVLIWTPEVDNVATAVMNADGEIVGLVNFKGGIWAFSRTGIWSFNPASSTAKVEGTAPRFGFSDDLGFLVSFRGELYGWIAHEVHRYDATDDVFEPLGLRGTSTLGACGVGTWFVVAVVSELTGYVELWAWDGVGWWQLDAATDTTSTTLSYPVSIAGAATDADLLVGHGTTANRTSLYQLLPRASAPGLRDSFVVVSSLLDAGARDTDKAWRQVGVELAWPDARGSADSVTVQLEASTDGGKTWTTAASASMAGTGDHVWSVEGPLAASARSRWLQLRVTVSSILDWSPVVVGLWAEYETLDAVAMRRRWGLAVECKDQVVRRDGAVDSTGARALSAGLWSLWDAGGVATFRDVDYDLAAVEYTVRIAGIAEEIPKPAEAGRWGDGVVTLTLVEV